MFSYMLAKDNKDILKLFNEILEKLFSVLSGWWLHSDWLIRSWNSPLQASYCCWYLIVEGVLTVMLRKVRSHGLDIDAHQRAELQLWLVHKRFGWGYLCACVCTPVPRLTAYQAVQTRSNFINNSSWCFQKGIMYLWKFMPLPLRVGLVSYEGKVNPRYGLLSQNSATVPLEKGFSKIFGSKIWML